MSKDLREVYAEKGKTNLTFSLNPFVEMPKMRVSTVNLLNEYIKKNNAMPIIEKNNDLMEHTWYECPRCGKCFSKGSIEEYDYCYKCGQKLDVKNIAL